MRRASPFPSPCPSGWTVGRLDEHVTSPSSRGRAAGRLGRCPQATPSWPSARATAAAGSARSWEAPAGSAVLCSILLQARPAHRTSCTSRHGRWHSAAVQACRETAGVELSLKWPNDLVAEPGAMGDWAKTRPGATREAGASGATALKVAGILSEIVPPPPGAPDAGAAQGSSWVVVGIGINVNWPEHWPPPGSCDPDLASIAACATSLNRIAGRQVDRGELLGRLLRPAGRGMPSWPATGAAGRWPPSTADVCSTIGREVRVELPTRPSPGGLSTSTIPDACSSRWALASGPSPPATSSMSGERPRLRPARLLRAPWAARRAPLPQKGVGCPVTSGP